MLTAVYCGSDWEAPCELHTTAARVTAVVLVILPVAAASAAALRWRTRWVLMLALAVVPLQLWFLLGYGLTRAANSGI